MSHDKTVSVIQLVRDFTASLNDASLATEDFIASESTVEIEMLPNFEHNHEKDQGCHPHRIHQRM